MNINKFIIVFSSIIVVIVIFVMTFFKVNYNHKANLVKSVESKITEAAEKCFYEEKCNKEKIYLKELYKLNYLDRMTNPITKEEYNDNSYIKIDNDKFLFVEV